MLNEGAGKSPHKAAYCAFGSFSNQCGFFRWACIPIGFTFIYNGSLHADKGTFFSISSIKIMNHWVTKIFFFNFGHEFARQFTSTFFVCLDRNLPHIYPFLVIWQSNISCLVWARVQTEGKQNNGTVLKITKLSGKGCETWD